MTRTMKHRTSSSMRKLPILSWSSNAGTSMDSVNAIAPSASYAFAGRNASPQGRVRLLARQTAPRRLQDRLCCTLQPAERRETLFIVKSFAQVRRRPGVGNSQRAATVANELLTKSVHVADSMSSKAFILLARPEGFGPPTYGFVVLRGRVAGIARRAA